MHVKQSPAGHCGHFPTKPDARLDAAWAALDWWYLGTTGGTRWNVAVMAASRTPPLRLELAAGQMMLADDPAISGEAYLTVVTERSGPSDGWGPFKGPSGTHSNPIAGPGC